MTAGAIFWDLFKRHFLWLVASFCIVVILQFSWSWYEEWRTVRLTLLVGPGGSTAFPPARRIADRLSQSPGILENKFEVELVSTSGYEENRRRIEADVTGRILGFAHDGFGESEHVQILLPMEWNYCHIFCRKDLLPLNSRIDRNKDFGPSFGDVRQLLKPGRAYLGPRESGTRQVAELVLQQYGLSPDTLSTHGIDDWHEMRAAFQTEQIQIAFYQGTLDSPVMKAVAQDGKTILLGLNDSREALVQANAHLAPLDFAANLYDVGEFCPKPQRSIATRRVLACSSRMPERIAFDVASRAREAIKGTTELRWDMLPPDAARQAENRPFAYTVHPGARLVRDDRTPTAIPFTWWQTGAVIAVFLIGKLLQWLAEMDVQHFRRNKPQPMEQTSI